MNLKRPMRQPQRPRGNVAQRPREQQILVGLTDQMQDMRAQTARSGSRSSANVSSRKTP